LIIKTKKKRTLDESAQEDTPSKKLNKFSDSTITNTSSTANINNNAELVTEDDYTNEQTISATSALINNENSQSNDSEEIASIMKSQQSQENVVSQMRKKTVGRNFNSPIPKCGFFIVFSFLRQLFEKNNNEMNLDQIVASISDNAKIREQIPPQYDVKRFILLALNYLRSPQLPPHLTLLVLSFE
jgi:hypothetical protein